MCVWGGGACRCCCCCCCCCCRPAAAHLVRADVQPAVHLHAVSADHLPREAALPLEPPRERQPDRRLADRCRPRHNDDLGRQRSMHAGSGLLTPLARQRCSSAARMRRRVERARHGLPTNSCCGPHGRETPPPPLRGGGKRGLGATRLVGVTTSQQLAERKPKAWEPSLCHFHRCSRVTAKVVRMMMCGGRIDTAHRNRPFGGRRSASLAQRLAPPLIQPSPPLQLQVLPDGHYCWCCGLSRGMMPAGYAQSTTMHASSAAAGWQRQPQLLERSAW